MIQPGTDFMNLQLSKYARVAAIALLLTVITQVLYIGLSQTERHTEPPCHLVV